MSRLDMFFVAVGAGLMIAAAGMMETAPLKLVSALAVPGVLLFLAGNLEWITRRDPLILEEADEE